MNNNLQALINYAEQAMQQHNFEDALKRWAVVRDIFPKEYVSYCRAAEAAMQLGDEELARNLCREGIDNTPHYIKPLINYAEMPMWNPNESKKNVAIIFTITKNLTFALANMLIGLNRYSPDLTDEILVFHDGLAEKDMTLLKKLDSRLEFIYVNLEQYKQDHLKLNLPQFENYITRYSPFPFIKFDLFLLLNRYKHILYLEVDMLIQKNISPILQYDSFAWRQTGRIDIFLLAHQKFPFLKKGDPSPNGGLIYIDDSFPNYQNMPKKCHAVQSIMLYKQTWNDERCFAVLVKLDNIPFSVLPIEYNAWTTYNNIDNAYIIHSAGPEKFWNSEQISICFNEWNVNNKIWVNMGGTPYSGNFEKNCRFKTNREFLDSNKYEPTWKIIFQKICHIFPEDIVPTFDMNHHWMILNIKNIPNKIHYELSILNYDGNITIRIHCEGNELCTKKNKEIFQKLKNFVNDDQFVLFLKEDRLALEKKVSIDSLPQELTALFDKTLDYVKQSFASKKNNERERERESKNSAKNTALYFFNEKSLVFDEAFFCCS